MDAVKKKKDFSGGCKGLNASSWCHLSQFNVLRAKHLLSGHKMDSTAETNFTVAVFPCLRLLGIKTTHQIFISVFLPLVLNNHLLTRTTKNWVQIGFGVELKKTQNNNKIPHKTNIQLS